jgi:hypothetical protein
MPGTLQEKEAETPAITTRSVALIGPREASRRVLVRALTNTGRAIVREYSAYPAAPGDLSGIIEQRFDMLMIDADSDEACALALMEKFSARGLTVMGYSQRSSQDLIQRCMQAGARDLLPIPVDAEPATAEAPSETESHAPAAEEETPAASAAPAQAAAESSAAQTQPPAAPSQPEFETLIFRYVDLEPPRRKGQSLRLLLAAFISLLVTAVLAFALMPQLQPARAGLLSLFGVHGASTSTTPSRR